MLLLFSLEGPQGIACSLSFSYRVSQEIVNRIGQFKRKIRPLIALAPDESRKRKTDADPRSNSQAKFENDEYRK